MIKPDFNRTKIIATIGPASASEEVLKELITEGVDVIRLNFSHGTHQDHLDVIKRVKKINIENNLHVSLLADLQGPKIRLGEVKDGAQVIKTGDLVTVTIEDVIGTSEKFSINYDDFPKDAAPGDRILIDDGKIMLTVEETDGVKEVRARVVFGGTIQPRKGFNLPDTRISMPCLTKKDIADLDFALEHEVDWVALSFVRNAADIRHLRRLIRNSKSTAKIIAKIEKPEAIAFMDEIIDETDGAMVARGDLGVEIPMEEVPLAQKQIVQKCMEAAKPVIIATQIMDSMVKNPFPTRAEANDVANAVLDGADALMLSNETSVGDFPVEVIKNMQKIIKRVELQDELYHRYHPISENSVTFLSDAVCLNAVLMSGEVDASAIIGMTTSGYTAFKISSFRPNARIFIFSSSNRLLRMISLIWGVKGFYYDKYETTDQTFSDVIQILKAENVVEEKDIVINLASMPIDKKGRTNTIKVSHVE